MSREVPQPPHPSVPITDNIQGVPRFTREWYDWLDRSFKNLRFNSALTGTVTFAAATTAAVTFTTAEPSTDYSVHFDAPEDRRVWATSKTTTGFTANVSASSSATYGWILLRR